MDNERQPVVEYEKSPDTITAAAKLEEGHPIAVAKDHAHFRRRNLPIILL
jgi:hypothetical protein